MWTVMEGRGNLTLKLLLFEGVGRALRRRRAEALEQVIYACPSALNWWLAGVGC